jgi:hypothetical protein
MDALMEAEWVGMPVIARRGLVNQSQTPTTQFYACPNLSSSGVKRHSGLNIFRSHDDDRRYVHPEAPESGSAGHTVSSTVLAGESPDSESGLDGRMTFLSNASRLEEVSHAK